MPKLKTPVPKVFSYIRFSTPEQRLGDSERRQVAAAVAYAKKYGLRLDTSLNMRDYGVSGYKGHHRTRGALGAFLGLVEAGKILPGSILLVENIDRLGREGVAKTLRGIIFKLWDHGITLQTLSPEETYGPGCDEDPKFLALFLYLQRAHEESKRKSQLSRANWGQKRKQARENGTILTGRCPAWLEVKDGKFGVRSGAKESIRLVFSLKLQGLGLRRIAVKLNQDKTLWSPPKQWYTNPVTGQRTERYGGWRGSYVKKLLSNVAVIGQYQPTEHRDGKRIPTGDPIENYYPAVVDPMVFAQIQQLLAGNVRRGGRADKCMNIFTHLVKCAYCGGPMTLVDKGKPPRGYAYLRCERGYRGLECERQSVRYDLAERAILTNCRRLRPEEVLPNPGKQAAQCTALRDLVAGKIAEMQELESQIDNFVDQIGCTKAKAARTRYEAKLLELEQLQTKLDDEVDDLKRQLQDAETDASTFADWANDLKTLRKGISKKENVDLRLRLRAHLRQFIERIEVFAVGYQPGKWAEDAGEDSPPKARTTCRGKPVPHIPGPEAEDTLADGIADIAWDVAPGIARSPEFHGFLDYVRGLRQTKKAWFLRVHFKTGAMVDIVPTGSVASGMRLDESSDRDQRWKHIGPDIDKLWFAYRDAQRKEANRVQRDKLVTTPC
jgi:DNA invertase Pin-like site-specific DNA recombinase